MTTILGIFHKPSLLIIRDMLRDVPHMQPYRHASEYSEVIILLGELGNTPGDEAVVQLTDERY